MTDKKAQTKAGATELTEEELGEVQGGNFKIEIDGLAGERGKKADKPKATILTTNENIRSRVVPSDK